MKKTLYKHQKDMLRKASKNSKGVFQAPTGSGKTLVQQTLAEKEISATNNPIIVVRAPRIVLCNQLITNYVGHLLETGIQRNKLETICFHSGDVAELQLETPEEGKFDTFQVASTTSSLTLQNIINKASQRNNPLVIGVTYHSSVRFNTELEKLGITIDLDINDEAHFLVQPAFQESLVLFPNIAKRQYFFTATPRVSESDLGRGMNNKSLFGPMLGEYTIKQMVDAGCITRARYATITGEVNADAKKFVLDNFVTETLDNLRTQANGCASAKLLVATEGTASIVEFLQGDAFISLRKQGVNIITVSSARGSMTVNNQNVSKKVILEKLKEFGKDSNDLVVLHYDMLSEGIDVPGLNGVLIMRKMLASKFYQTVGRVIRTAPGKLYGMLYFPEMNTTNDLAADFKEKMENMRKDGYLTKEEIKESTNGDTGGNNEAADTSLLASIASSLKFNEELDDAKAVYSLGF